MKLHVQYIRIIAIIMVVLNHSDFCLTYYRNTDNIVTFLVSLFITSICGVGVPLFMMITGALLIPKQENISVIIKKRVPRVLVALILFSFVIYVIQFLSGQGEFNVLDFVNRLLSGNIQVSYWYLYEYIAILLMLPVISRLALNMAEEQFRYLFALALIFKMALPMITFWLDFSIPMNFPILTNSIYYLVMGYYVENALSDESMETLSYKKIWGCILICLMIPIAYVLIDAKLTGELVAQPFGMTDSLLVICIYLLVKKMCKDMALETKRSKLVVELGKSVFGVYLIERIGQKVFLPLYLFLCDKTVGVLACSVYVTCILIFCFAVVGILRRINIVKKIL